MLSNKIGMSFVGASARSAAAQQVQRRTFLSRAPMNRHLFRRSKSSLFNAQRAPMAASVWAEEASSSSMRFMQAGIMSGEPPGMLLVLPTAVMLGAFCAPNASYEMMNRMGAGAGDERVRRGSFPYAY